MRDGDRGEIPGNWWSEIKSLRLGDVKTFNFTEIVSPVGEAGFNAIENSGVKGEDGVPLILRGEAH